MPKTHRDTLDCLTAELHDCYRSLVKAEMAWEEKRGDHVQAAMASMERAFQLVSDLKAAQS